MFLHGKGIEEYMLPCAFKKTLGVDCIGCGLQRSLALLIKGDFVGAFYMYPAIYPLIVLLLFIIFDYFKHVRHGEKIKLVLAGLFLLSAVTNYILKFI